MFKKLFASVGASEAKIDTVLLTEKLVPGHNFSVQINIKGGSVDQNLEGLKLTLMCQSDYEDQDYDVDEYEGRENIVLQSWDIDVANIIHANGDICDEYELTLHPEAPITANIGNLNHSRVWIETGLKITSGADASDRDYVDIYPTPTQEAFINAMLETGYHLTKIDIESGDISNDEFSSDFDCYQEFEFRLDSGGFFGINEVELSFVDDGENTGVLVQVDRSFSSDYSTVFLVSSELNCTDEAISILQVVLS
jgi:sporulation-control protein